MSNLYDLVLSALTPHWDSSSGRNVHFFRSAAVVNSNGVHYQVHHLFATLSSFAWSCKEPTHNCCILNEITPGYSIPSPSHYILRPLPCKTDSKSTASWLNGKGLALNQFKQLRGGGAWGLYLFHFLCVSLLPCDALL